MVVLDVGYRFYVRPGELAAVEDEIEPALCVVRVEEGMGTHQGAVAHASGITHPRRPVLSIAGIACVDTGLAVAQWELDPDVTGTGDLRIGRLCRLKLEPADCVSRATGSGRRLGNFEREGGRNGGYGADADNGWIELSTSRLCDVVHRGKVLGGHGSRSW